MKKIKEKIDDNTCTISDLKGVYDIVNTKAEVIVAEQNDITHLYYRDNQKKTVILEKDLIPYERKIYDTREPAR